MRLFGTVIVIEIFRAGNPALQDGEEGALLCAST